MIKYLKQLFYYFYHMTPKGKKKQMQGFASNFMAEENTLDTITKLEVVHTATKVMKQKKLLNFHKGKSITKPKSSNHKIKKVATGKHARQLKNRGIIVNEKGEFVHA